MAGNYSEGRIVQIFEDTVFTAIWKDIETSPEPTKYTIAFDANGGDGYMGYETHAEGTDFVIPSCRFTAPTGYEFSYWETDCLCADDAHSRVAYNPEDTLEVTENLYLKAIWKEKTSEPNPPATEYTISFDANGGSGTMDDVTVEDGEHYVVPGCRFEAPEGMAFDFWEADGESYLPGDAFMVGGDLSFKAIWKEVTSAPIPPATEYTISFDSNGGSGTMDDVVVEEGEDFTLPECEFEAPEGYEFYCWELLETSGTQFAPGEKVEVTEDMTFKAIWDEIEYGNLIRPSGGKTGTFTYEIESSKDIENGSFSVDKNSSKPNKIVTVTVKPDKGYEVYVLLITDNRGDRIPYVDNGDGTYTFEMPYGNVYIEPVFNKIEVKPEVKEEKQIIKMTIDINAILIGNEYIFNDVPPVISNSRTVIPIRVVAEAMGSTVSWDAEAQKVTIVKGGKIIEIYVGQNFAVVDGSPVELDVAAFIEGGRTYLPLRFVAENLGGEVSWNGETKEITILY